MINARSFRVEIEVEAADGDEGVLVAHGDQGGGYAVYVEDGVLRLRLQRLRRHDGRRLRTGARRAVADRARHGGARQPPLARHRLASTATQRAEQRDLVMLTAIAPFEGIDVGIDRRSPVSWDLYERRGPFPFTGAIKAVTYVPGELAPDAGERWIDFLRESGARFE